MSDKKMPVEKPAETPFSKLMDGVASKATLNQIDVLKRVVELFPAGSSAANTATANIAELSKMAARECFNESAFEDAALIVSAAGVTVAAELEVAVAAATAAYDAAVAAASGERKESVAAAIEAANTALLTGIGIVALPENLPRQFELPNGLLFGPLGITMPRQTTAPRAETRGRGRTGMSEHQTRIAELYDRGCSARDIAELVGGTNASAILQSLERACRKGWAPKRHFARIDYI